MTTIAPTQALSIASQLSIEDRQAGLRCLHSLPTAVYMSSVQYPIDNIVDQFFICELDHDLFSRFLRKLGGVELSVQKATIKELLSSLKRS